LCEWASKKKFLKHILFWHPGFLQHSILKILSTKVCVWLPGNVGKVPAGLEAAGLGAMIIQT
jgi:hypothetical protein